MNMVRDEKKKIVRFGFLVAVCVACLSGCATVVNGTKQKVTVNTVPPGATAKVRGQTVKTPGVLLVKRKEFNTVIVSQEGYKTEKINLSKEMNPWVWGNVPLFAILLAPLPMAYDTLFGGGYDQMPAAVNIALKPISAGGPEVNSISETGLLPLPGMTKAELHASHAKPQKARICVINPYVFGGGITCWRILDNKEAVGLISSYRYMCWERLPGSVKLAITDGDRQDEIELNVVGGQTYFFAQATGGRTQITPVDSSRAKQMLEKCKPLERSAYVAYQ